MEDRLDSLHGSERQRVRARERLEVEPSAASSGPAASSFDYPDFPAGVPMNEEEELQALRMGHTVPDNFDPQRYIRIVEGRPVMAIVGR